MIEIGTTEAKRLSALQEEEIALPHFLATLAALGVREQSRRPRGPWMPRRPRCPLAVDSCFRDQSLASGDVHDAVQPFPSSDHQSIRRSPGTKSKCRSRLKRGRECWRQSAAIHRSFAGMGLVFFFNSRPIAAYE